MIKITFRKQDVHQDRYISACYGTPTELLFSSITRGSDRAAQAF